MTESRLFGYQEDLPGAGPPQPPVANNPMNPMGQYKFTPEELHVLQECNKESFFKRSLPIGTFLGLGTLSAVQRGIFKPNARFGAFPKVTLAVVVGYFLGKLSYQQTCAEKLMALPGSYIGQLLRDRKEGRTSALPKQTTTMFGANPKDIYSDAGPGSSLDLDTDRPLFNEDAYKPEDSSEGREIPAEVPPLQPSLSYEDLRRKNRGDYSEARQDPYKMDQSSTPAISRTPAPAQPRSTNKYGDVVD